MYCLTSSRQKSFTEREVRDLKASNGVEPKFGFSWFYWFPDITINRKMYHSTTVFKLLWLFFIINIDRSDT